MTLGKPLAKQIHEFDFHVLVHSNVSGQPTYTIGVWERQTLRAICHVAGFTGALLALAQELVAHSGECPKRTSYPQSSEISELIKRLHRRANAECAAAAGYLEDMHALLHNATGESDTVREPLTQLGALIEEASSNSQLLPEAGSIAIPQRLWFRLLRLYRHKQEGEEVYQELRRLREVAGITAEALQTVDDWLGSASTREAAMDALWRLRRILDAVGFSPPLDHLEFRGQLIRAMEESGVGLGDDGVLRIRQSHDRNWQPASGPPVKEILQSTLRPSA